MSRRARVQAWRLRTRGRLVRGVSGAERHPIVVGLVVLAITAFGGYVSVIAINGVPFQDRYRLSAVMPPTLPPLKSGNEVRIAGQRVGTVRRVTAQEDSLFVDMDMEPEYAPVGRDAEVHVRAKLVASLIYIQIDPGDTRDPLPEGSVIPSSRVRTSSTLPLVAEAFDAETREALGRTIEVTGTGLRGQGAAAGSALKDLPPILEHGTPLLDSFTPRKGELRGLLEGTRRTASGLTGRRPDDIAATLTAGRVVVGAIAARSEALGGAVERLRPLEDAVLAALPVADPLLADVERLSRRLEPGVRSLGRALPDVNATLAQGDSVRRHVGNLTTALNPVLRALAPALGELYVPALTARPTGNALGDFADLMRRYRSDIKATGRGLVAVTRKGYPEGPTAPGNPALRFSGVLTCHRARDPFPEPREARRQRKGCEE